MQKEMRKLDLAALSKIISLTEVGCKFGKLQFRIMLLNFTWPFFF